MERLRDSIRLLRFYREFQSVSKFIHWYNFVRPHTSLSVNELRTPAQLFFSDRLKD